MKLFGNTGKRYKKSRGIRRVLKVLLILLVVAALLAGGAYMAFLYFIEPPDVNTPAVASEEPAENQSDSSDLLEEEPEVNLTGRRDNVYTFLVAGEDADAGGTDVIMVGLLDTDAGTLDVISIPRDTVVNVPWGTKKINSYKNMYTYLDEEYDQYVDALIDGVSKLIGYPVDCWVTIDMEGFVSLVDTIGGVDFDVPQRMYRDDPLIDLYEGMQTLSGEQALQLVRYRSYTDGDIQRVKVQQDFLKALADQLISMKNLLKVNQLVQIFQENVETDMSFSNLGFFANEFLKLSSDNINFHSVDETTANIYDEINDTSYVTLYVDEWLEMVNSYINPFTYEITEADVEILTRDETTGAFYVTSGTMYTNWS